jgi:hypothetical protein
MIHLPFSRGSQNRAKPVTGAHRYRPPRQSAAVAARLDAANLA